jgi:5-methylcytosine-specific restriction endonuclease McrA
MPKYVNGKRDYTADKKYQSSAEQRKKRSERNKARRQAGLKVGDPREVDHKKPLSKGGSNSKSNLRIISRKENRKKYNK